MKEVRSNASGVFQFLITHKIFLGGLLLGGFCRFNKKAGRGFPAIAIAHATLGTVAEIFGIYIILSAGTNLLPETLRFKNYKKWMRLELLLW